MAIQWFPGHMHLTKKAISERIKEIDVVIELLDARLPGSSANPMLAELTSGKPALKVLNKRDLADATRTPLWLDHYNSLPNTRAIELDASEAMPARRLIDACHALAPTRGTMVKPMRVLICGIPNVGKSTLINTLTGKRATKTGDEAGITKVEQRLVLADGFICGTRPACCGRASSSPRAATTWPPAARSAAMPLTKKRWRSNCSTT
jgi:ribosome biogenesis GTPase A